VQFRTLPEALAAGRVDVALAVADELSADTRRQPLFSATYRLLFDPRHRTWKRTPSMARYLEAEHVVVSYNGDVRGFVEDFFGVQRTVRCSIGSFEHIGAMLVGSDLVATVPDLIAWQARRRHPKLTTLPVPFAMPSGTIDIIWRAVVDDDPAVSLVRELLTGIFAAEVATMNGF